jgi:type II secretory pathway component PulF
MKFSYEACDSTGVPKAGIVEAPDAIEAMEILRRQGLFVSRIDAATAGRGGGSAGGHRRRRRIGRGRLLKNLAMFSRQLFVLNSSGTPLTEALHSLERQTKDSAWRAVVAELCRRVEQGDPLSAAMADQPHSFDPVCRSLVAAGETSGNLSVMLDRVATLTRKQLQTRSAIIGALIYPCLLVVVSFGVLLLMLLYVLPRFAGMFQSLNVPLPVTTRFLMSLSGLLQNYWWLALGAMISAAVGFKIWASTDHGTETLHRVVLRLPIAGKLLRSFAVARIMRVVGVLSQGSVPLLDALALARQTMTNRQYARLVARAEAAVTRGSTISSALADSPLVEPAICEAVRSGEQSGQLGGLLLNLAGFLDEDNEVVVRSLTSILEPIILIALGVVVGFVAMSMFLPMFDLTAMTQHG